ncbi:MAG: sensor histidine kinase [Chloroflexota bacterium]
MDSFQELAGEVRSLREQIVLKERLAALGEVSAGIAHELRNPLGVIAGYGRLLLKSFDAGDERSELVQKILGEVEEMNRVIEELSRFSKIERVEKADVEISRVVGDVVESMGMEGRNVEISLNEMLRVKGDEALVKQAVRNLIQNGIEAGRRVWVDAHRASVGGKDGVTVKVRDDGEGIAPEDLEKVFLPFYTRKERGMGIGLSLVQKIAQAHKGRVTVESTRGKGSTFHLFLPNE